MQSPARPDPIALTWLRRSGRGSSSAPPPASSPRRGGPPRSPRCTRHPQPHRVPRCVLATPCASPTQNLPPSPPPLRLPPLELREGAIKRGNREGGGWVTSAPRTLSPGRKGQRGGTAGYRQQRPLPGSACTPLLQVPQAQGHGMSQCQSRGVRCPCRRGARQCPQGHLLPEAVSVPVGVQRLQVLPIVDALPTARTHRQVGPCMERGTQGGQGCHPACCPHPPPSSTQAHPSQLSPSAREDKYRPPPIDPVMGTRSWH